MVRDAVRSRRDPCDHAMTCQSLPGLNEPAAPPKMKFIPSISQIAGVPSLLCHRMSDLPSPLKSPVPSIVPARPWIERPDGSHGHGIDAVHQPDGGLPSLFCQRMSDLPSPLKSPVPLICQLGPGLNGPAAPTNVALGPSISQIAACAVVCSATGCRTCRRR